MTRPNSSLPASHRGLFRKIYLYSFGLLIMTALTAALATHLARNIGETPPFNNYDRIFGHFLSPYLPDSAAPPDSIQPSDSGNRLQAFLEELSTITRISFLILDSERRPIAHTGPFEQETPGIDDYPTSRNHRFFLRNHMANLFIPLYADDQLRGYALLSWRGAGHIRFITVALAVLAILAIMPYLFARAITRPLRRIASTATAIGEGDLASRTGIDRTDEIGLLAREVDRMAGRIEQLIGSEKTLMANISHEIRTPLARIRVLLEIIEESPDRQGLSSDALSGLGADVAELERLLEDVFLTAKLDLAMQKKAESSFVLHPTMIAIDDLLRGMEQELVDRSAGRRIRIVAPDNLPQIHADTDLICRVIRNLVDNALKYSREGEEIFLEASHDEDSVIVMVRDRGEGVAEQDLDRIFEPFFRAERSGHLTDGVGIGLALCRRIIEAHGGWIGAKNRPEGGLEVEFRLPAVLPDHEE